MLTQVLPQTLSVNVAYFNFTVNSGATLNFVAGGVIDIIGSFTNNGTVNAAGDVPISITVGTWYQLNMNGNITSSTGAVTLDSGINIGIILTGASTTTSTSGTITFKSKIDGGSTLDVDAGTGLIDFQKNIGVSTPPTTLTITQSGGTTFQGNVETETSVVLIDTADGANITFTGALVTPTLTTGAQGYDVDLHGTGTIITNLLEFLNTGAVSIGNATADTLTFNSGIETTGNGTNPSSTILNGTTVTLNDTIVFGTTTVSGDSTVNSAGGAVTLGAATINDTKTLTVGTGNTGAISTSTIDSAGGGSGNLTINTDDTATLNGHVGGTTPIGTFTLTNGNLATGGNDLRASGITVNGGTFNSASAAGTWDLSGGVTIAGGATLNATSGTLNVGGDWSNSGTFSHKNGTVTFDGSAAQTINGANSFYNLTVNNSHATDKVDASGSASLAVTNNLSITDGIFKSASDYANVTIGANGTMEQSDDITVSGNWTNSGTLTHNNNTVTLDGVNQSISGPTTFYKLTKTVAAADTLTFQNGSANKVTVSNAMTLSGAAGQLLSLRSSSDGNQWEIDPQSTRTIAYLDVKDSKNVNATAINAAGTNSVDSGNNTN